MKRPGAGWLVPIVVIIGLCYLLPFTLLREVDAWYGSFGFWAVATMVVIAINAVISSRWRD